MDYHIGSKSADNMYGMVYVHLPILATKNVAGTALNDNTLTYQRALKEKLIQDSLNAGGDGIIKSQVPDIGTELISLQNGSVVEVTVNFRFSSPDQTNAQRKTQIENGNENMRGVKNMKLDIADANSDLYKEIIEPLAWWDYKANTV